MKRLNFKVAVAAKRAEILLYDSIGEDIFGGISAKTFADELAKAKGVSQIDVRINSPGGDAFAGFTMYNLLKSHKAKVNVYVDGLAASAASIIAVAGDEIEIAANGMMMIHNAWTIVSGDSEAFAKQADLLAKIDQSIAETYAAKTKGSVDTIRTQMAVETWLTAEQAKEQGFADRIGQEHAIAACIRPDVFKYRNVPPQFIDRGESEPAAPFHEVLKADLARFERKRPFRCPLGNSVAYGCIRRTFVGRFDLE